MVPVVHTHPDLQRKHDASRSNWNQKCVVLLEQSSRVSPPGTAHEEILIQLLKNKFHMVITLYTGYAHWAACYIVLEITQAWPQSAGMLLLYSAKFKGNGNLMGL